MSFVTPKLSGRCGNQFFQISTAISYALKHGIEYKIPEQTSSKYTWKAYFNHFPKLTKRDRIRAVHCETDFTYKEIPKKESVQLIGWFQSEKYFVEHRLDIIKAFNFKYEKKEGWCSIHNRLGDYLQLAHKHPPITADYLDKAIKYICDKGVNKFLVFSDDIEATRRFIDSRLYYGVEFEYSKGSEIEDIENMSSCEHNIIANSTFSFMSAWMNQNENKIVVSPSKENWFGEGNKHLNTKDLIPDSWIQIKY
jgi:hypothetical protein